MDQRPQPSEQSRLVLPGQLMLPDPNYFPALGAEGAGDEFIAGLVAGDFLAPEFRVMLRLRAVDRAAVPEAAVDEDRQMQFEENEIRFARELRSAPPAGDAVRTKKRD